MLTQGRCTAEQYTIEFEILEADCFLGDIALMDIYKRGLNDDLVEKIYSVGNMPDSLREWKHWAKKLDKQKRMKEDFQSTKRVVGPSPRPRGFSTIPVNYRPNGNIQIRRSPPPQGNTFRNQGFRNQFSQQGYRPTPTPAQAPAGGAQGGAVPMEIDQAVRRGNQQPYNPMRCFKCGMPGHRAVECRAIIRVMETHTGTNQGNNINEEGNPEGNGGEEGFVSGQTA